MLKQKLSQQELLMQIPQIQEWLNTYARNSPKTVERYLRDALIFCNVCGIDNFKRMEQVNEKDIDLIYVYSKERNWSNNTTSARLQSMRILFDYLNSTCRFTQNNFIFKTIKKLKNDAEPIFTPTKPQCKAMLESLKKHTKKKRAYVMTKFFLSSGIRKSECLNLKISDIYEEYVRIVGKGSKIANQQVSPEVLDLVRDYIATDRAETMEKYKKMGGKDLGYVFVSGIGDIDSYTKRKKNLTNGNQMCINAFNAQLKNIGKFEKLDFTNKLSPHKLRHYYGTETFNETKDIVVTQGCLRHGSPGTSWLYISQNADNYMKIARKIARDIANFDDDEDKGDDTHTEFELSLIRENKMLKEKLKNME